MRRARGAFVWTMLVLAAGCAARGCTCDPPEPGRLTVRNRQVHLDGNPLQLAGYSDYGIFYDRDMNGQQLTNWLNRLQGKGINFLRQWVLPLPDNFLCNDANRNCRCDANEVKTLELQPVALAATPDTCAAPPCYDFTRLDTEFWTHVDTVLNAAAERNMIVQVTLWDQYTLRRGDEPLCNYFETNPLQRRHGGPVPFGHNDTGFPDFYREPVRSQIEAYTRLVMARLATHWNVIVETMNEPGQFGGSTKADVDDFHAAIDLVIASQRPPILISHNLVFPDCDRNDRSDFCEDRDYNGKPDRCDQDPGASHCDKCTGDFASSLETHPHGLTSLSSVHGLTWACNCTPAGAQEATSKLSLVSNALIIDDDALRSGSFCSRDDNTRVRWFAERSCEGGAAAFNHRDFEPYSIGGNPDEDALTAIQAGTSACQRDRTAPAIAITAPTANQTVPAAPLVVHGTSSDNGKVVLITVNTNQNNAYAVVAGSTPWQGTVDLTGITPGQSVILTATALDNSSNFTQSSVTVTIRP